MDSTVDYYRNLLETSTLPHAVLVDFCKSVLGLESLPKEMYAKMYRLSRLYGTKEIFLAILDCAEMENINTVGLEKLIAYFAKKRIEKAGITVPDSILNSLVVEKKKEIRNNSKINYKIEDIFGGENE
jgi:hypothetical protein